MQKKVYIIILNWNGWQDTLECLDSLKNISYDNFSIVVVDNGSKDDSVYRIKNHFAQFAIRNSQFIILDSNLGFAGGNNAGIKYAMENGADYILLINNDTIVDKNFLGELVEAGEADNKIGLAGPKIYYYSEPNRIWFAGGKINWLKNSGKHRGLDEIDAGQYDKARKVDYLTGCSLLIKREVIEKIGGLSNDYFLYYEDTDFCLRAKSAGYKCLYVPSAEIYHKVSRSTKPGSSSYVYYHTRNGLTLAKRNGTALNKMFIYLYCALLFAKQIIKIAFIPSKREWAFAVLKGERDFLLGRMGK